MIELISICSMKLGASGKIAQYSEYGVSWLTLLINSNFLYLFKSEKMYFYIAKGWNNNLTVGASDLWWLNLVLS